MFSKIYWLPAPQLSEKQLGIMPRPRGNDWLEDEIRGLQFRQVNIIVSLLEFGEIHELGLAAEEDLCHEKGIHFIHFPIEDVNIPKNEKKYFNLIDQLIDALEKGNKIVIHCRMGIGRASLIAAGVLIKLGVQPENVFDFISKARELSVPDTEEQKQWVLNWGKG